MIGVADVIDVMTKIMATAFLFSLPVLLVAVAFDYPHWLTRVGVTMLVAPVCFALIFTVGHAVAIIWGF